MRQSRLGVLALAVILLVQGFFYLQVEGVLLPGFEAQSGNEKWSPEDELVEPSGAVAEKQVISMEMDAARQWKIRVVTYNIRHGEGLDGILDLARIAAILRELDPDVIALQEVDNNFSPRSDWEDQAQVLAELLDMEVAYGPALRSLLNLGRGPGYYGNAILSKYPLQNVNNVVVEAPGLTENRAFLHSEITSPIGSFHFISTHLGLEHDHRLTHLTKMLAYVAELEGPVIVAGDFNSTSASLEVKAMFEAGLRDSAALLGRGLEPTLIGPKAARIDYVFTTADITVKDVAVVDADGSDHRPVVVDLTLPLL